MVRRARRLLHPGAVRLAAEAVGLSVDISAVAAQRDEACLRRVWDVGEVAAVAALLRRQRGRRRLALATGNTREPVRATAKALGLLDQFDVVITREDVSYGKPAPDIFAAAALGLGLESAQCLGL